jgi:NAD(P)-dependent dehydrogenase (short-subunit alcohol dehydrogenase family)
VSEQIDDAWSSPLTDMLRMDGRTAIITGGGRGIGRAVATAFAQLGAKVAVLARSADEIGAVQREIEAHGGQALAAQVDITDSGAVKDAYERVTAALGPVDTVVNNAGNLLYKSLVPLPGAPAHFPTFDGPISDEEWSSVLGTHLDGTFFLVREALPSMLERRHGRVVNIVSNSILRHGPFVSSYDTAKGAVTALTRSLAHEVAHYGVTVNAIAAGHFYTAMTAAMHDDPEANRRVLQRVPMRRIGELREIAALAAYLVSEPAGFMTGQVVALDGGESL